MKQCKLILLILFFVCPLIGQAQNASLQELVNKKQFALVAARADSLTQADSTDYLTMSAIGQAYEGLLRYKDAYLCFKHCLGMDTTNVDALNAVARVAANYGKIAEAKRCYQKVLETDSLNYYACYQLARLYYQLGDYGQATEYYHTLSAIEGENPAILTGLADCHIKRGGQNVLIALDLYSRALELNPENIRTASSLINTLLQMGQGESALQVCDTALFYNPDNRQIRQSKGMALYMTKKYSDADTIYTSLLAEGDSSFLNLKYAGAARFMSGHPLDAVESLEGAFDIDSTDIETIILYGASLGKTYDRKRSYQLFDLAEETMQPKRFYVNLLTSYRADALQRDGRFNDAEKIYYEAWKKDPGQLNFLSEISRHYWDLDPELAKNETRLQKAIFGKYTYLKAYIDAGKPMKEMYHYRPFMEKVCEDAFFKSQTEVAMLAPDGKRSKVSVSDLQAIIKKLPEMPEDMKKMRAQMEAAMKRREAEDAAKRLKGDTVAQRASWAVSQDEIQKEREKQQAEAK